MVAFLTRLCSTGVAAEPARNPSHVTDDDIQTSEPPFFFERLGLAGDADERAIKRAYARELKLIDLDADPAAFQVLREAYEAALSSARLGGALQLQGSDPAFDEIDRAAREMQLPTVPRRAPGTPDKAAPAGLDEADEAHEEYVVADPDELAEQVLGEFLAHCATLVDAHDSGPWEAQLRAALADARMLHVDARKVFEQRIANLLAAGWRAGHHCLLPAAVKVFEWGADRRRVQSLGNAGYTLYFAIEQRAVHELQYDEVRRQQRELVARLRDPAPPTTDELIALMPVLGTLEAHFPAWLSLISDADNIARWHRLDRDVSWFARVIRRRDLRIAIVPAMLTLLLFGAIIFFGGDAPDKPDVAAANIAAQYVEEGDKLLDQDMQVEAAASYERAIAADPAYASAYAGRALALIFQSKYEQAEPDLKTLESLDPDNAVLFRARGLIAHRQDRFAEAIAAYTRSLELNQDNTYTLLQRGNAYLADKQLDAALGDADRVLALEPAHTSARYLRARVFNARNDIAAAKGEAEAVMRSVDKRGPAAFGAAAFILRELGDHAGAVAAMDKYIAASPGAAQFVTRSQMRQPSDFAARRNDLEAALNIEPDSVPANLGLLRLEIEAKRWDAVIAVASGAMARKSMKDEKQFLLLSRGVAYAKRDSQELAGADFDAARMMATTAVELNNLCYEMAVQNVALQRAMEMCDASLAQAPDAVHTLDSKAFTLMRMRQYRQALPLYEGLIKASPEDASFLYGRGVALYRLGDKAAGKRDIKAALAMNAGVGDYYARLDMRP